MINLLLIKYIIKKFGINELTYNPCLLNKSSLLENMKMQINDILILANNNFVNNEEIVI